MVTSSAISNDVSCLLGGVDGPLILKVRSREHHGHILRLQSAKCTIGSHSSCTLRLLCAGVRPFHCLILRGQAGVFIRRLAPSTHLNGTGFTDRWLRVGDVLNLGPIELEVLSTAACDDPPGRVPRAAGSRGATAAPNPPRDLGHSPASDPAQPFSGGERSGPPAATCPTLESPQPGANTRCEHCRQERQQLESILRAHADASNQHRNAVLQHCDDLKKQLQKNQSRRAQTPENTDSSPSTGVQQQVTYRDLIGSLREELHQLKDQYGTQLAEQDRLLTHVSTVEQDLVGLRVAHEQAVWENHKQREQLQELRRQLDESVEQLLASKNRTAELQSSLEQARDDARRTSDTEHSLRDEISRLRAQRDQTLAEREAERVKYRESLQADKTAKTREIAEFRELADGVRQELQEEREAHQRVRDEWHIEREDLQKELAKRSTTLQNLREAYDELVVEHERATREAESLILSQQQEGQQLLTQLHEAKQALRQAERERTRTCHQARQESPHEQTTAFTANPRDDAAGGFTELAPAASGTLAPASTAEGPPPEGTEAEHNGPSEHAERDATSEAPNAPTGIAGEQGGESNDAACSTESKDAEQAPTLQTVAMPWSQLPDEVKSQVLSPPNETPSPQASPEMERQASADVQRHDVASQPPTDQPQPVPPHARTGTPEAHAPEPPPEDPALDDHEGFIQQYMDRLLKRTATSDVPPSASSASSAETHWTTAVSTGNEWQGDTPPRSAEDGSREHQPVPPAQIEASPCNPPAEQTTTKPRSKTETPNDFNKMREVANISSSEAIQHSESKKLLARCLHPLLAASVLSLLGAAAIATCSATISLQGMAGGLALATSGALVLLAGSNYYRWRGVKRRSRTETYSP